MSQIWNAEKHGEKEKCFWPRRLGLGSAGAEFGSASGVVERPPAAVEKQKLERGKNGVIRLVPKRNSKR